MSTLIFWLASVSASWGACTVITGGEVYTPDGLQSGASVVIDGDRIAGVGTAVPGLAGTSFKGEDCAVVDAAGGAVTPGFIEVRSQLGLVEVGLESATNDHNPGGEDSVRAALQVVDAYNPRSSLIPIQRVEGVTSAVVHPSGGRISGQAGLVVLAGATQAEAVKNASVAMIASAGGESRAMGLRELRQALLDARAFRAAKGQWERGQSREFVASADDLEALHPVLTGELPMWIGADRAADIEALLRLQEEIGFQLVVVGGAEAWMHAEALALARVSVVIDPLVYGAGSFNQIHGRPDNAALLSEAGVQVIIATGESHNARNLGQLAGNAVRGGMDHADALAAITSTPARALGLGERGELKAGALADVVVWSGSDPLELSSLPTAVFIEGASIALESRQTRLRDAYKDLPGTPVPPLSLPGAD